jgi:DNA-directed RNA polymerase specialized sigma24 family protein
VPRPASREAAAEEAVTDCDLVARAKAGERDAVNEVLRQAIPALRRIVAVALAQTRCFSLFDDALADAMERAWNAIPKWDPARGSLAALVRLQVLEETRRLASYLGHAVDVPHYDGANETRYAQDRERALGRARSMEATGRDSESGIAPSLSETIQAPFVDPAHAVDAQRVLARIDAEAASVLWRVACDETYGEIGAERGVTKEAIRNRHMAAVAAARWALDIHAQEQSEDIDERLRQREARLVSMLGRGPMSGSDLNRYFGHDLAEGGMRHWLDRLREDGAIVVFKQGRRTMYALPDAQKVAA